MEDALAPPENAEFVRETAVLILVVMEDALAHIFKGVKKDSGGSLNPCCNGRCTRTEFQSAKSSATSAVLILVVMEDALALSI